MNALNLLDGIDGLAGLVGCILSAAVAVMALMTGHQTIALIATVLAGSLVGFLRFNLPPASMYLGDAGSMLIGLAVGVMAIRASLKGPGTVLLAVPLALWTIPIFDTAAAILRRILTGRSIYTTDRAHLHHHLVERIGHRKSLVCIAGASLLTSVAALLSVWWKQDSIAILSGGFVVLMFVSLRVFGHTEVLLAAVRVRSLLRSIFWPRPRDMTAGWDDVVHLQGTRQWGVLWETLTESAGRMGFVQLCLDLNVPTLGEGYHAAWNRPNNSESNRLWRLELPLLNNDRVLGYVKVVGDRAEISRQNLEQMAELLEQIETHLGWLIESRPDIASAALAGAPASGDLDSDAPDVLPIRPVGVRKTVLERY